MKKHFEKLIREAETHMKTYNMADIARELGVSRQAIRGRHERSKKNNFRTFPPPDGEYAGKPFWLEETLQKAGVIK